MRNPSILKAFVNVFEEGGFFRFYRGMFPEMIAMFPKNSMVYMSYEKSRRYFEKKNNGMMNLYVAFVAGMVSGVAEGFTENPFQVVKVRMQSIMYIGKYQNSWDCTKQMLRQEGIKSFARGLGPTMWSNTLWNGVWFSMMYQFKDWLPESSSHVEDLLQTLVTSFIAGLVATGFNAPFDMTRARFQEEMMISGKPSQFRWTLVTLLKIFKEEGFVGCYKGFVPKSIRMGVGGAVCVTSYEAICHAMPNN